MGRREKRVKALHALNFIHHIYHKIYFCFVSKYDTQTSKQSGESFAPLSFVITLFSRYLAVLAF